MSIVYQSQKHILKVIGVFKADVNHELELCINLHMYCHTIWHSICSYPLNLHGKCEFDPRCDLKVKFHSVSHC